MKRCTSLEVQGKLMSVLEFDCWGGFAGRRFPGSAYRAGRWCGDCSRCSALLLGVDIRYAIGASLVSVIATSSGAAATYEGKAISNIRIGMFWRLRPLWARWRAQLGHAHLHLGRSPLFLDWC